MKSEPIVGSIFMCTPMGKLLLNTRYVYSEWDYSWFPRRQAVAKTHAGHMAETHIAIGGLLSHGRNTHRYWWITVWAKDKTKILSTRLSRL